MAFFNLWSSERLSFSLSIIAVVSAAITTFHQFHSKTDVKVTFSACEYVVNDTTEIGILKLSGIFMNSGTTPVALKASSVFFSIDTTRNNGKVNGWQAQMTGENWRLYEDSPFHENVLDGFYVAPGSAEAFKVEWRFNPSKVLHLVEEARRNQQFSVWDSTLVTVEIGLFATLVSPEAKSSSKRMFAATQWFDVSDTLNPRPTSSAFGNGFYHFESWEPMEENWEPKEVATDPT